MGDIEEENREEQNKERMLVERYGEKKMRERVRCGGGETKRRRVM